MHIKPSDAVDLSADNMTNVHEEVKVIAKTLRFFLFHKRMKNHCRLLKERMKNQTVCYIDLL